VIVVNMGSNLHHVHGYQYLAIKATAAVVTPGIFSICVLTLATQPAQVIPEI